MPPRVQCGVARRRWPAGSRRQSAGGALLEFAATLPLLFAVLLAVVDFSTYLNDRTSVSAAAYNGAKAAAKNPLACGAGSETRARQAVAATLDGMLSVSGEWELEAPHTSGPPDVRRYAVTVRFERDLSLMSAFTATIPAFRTLRMTGVALCE